MTKEYFIISQVSRSDIQDALNLSPEDFEKLTDERMQDIADRMGEMHTDEFYWDDLKQAYLSITKEE